MDSLVAHGVVAATVLVVVILARAAWHKTSQFLPSVGFAQDYGVLPEALVPTALRLLALAEAATVLLLLLPATRQIGGLGAAGLFLGYGLLMALALSRGKTRIDCGCGGAPQIVSGATVARNAVLAGVALAIAAAPLQVVGPWGAALGILAGLMLTLLYTIAETLISHARFIRRQT